MKLAQLERSILEDFIYYHLVIFPHEGQSGHDYPVAYKTMRNAEKTAKKLIKTGKYYSIMVRRNEVIKQVPYTTDFSINSPVIELKGNEVKYYENRVN